MAIAKQHDMQYQHDVRHTIRMISFSKAFSFVPLGCVPNNSDITVLIFTVKCGKLSAYVYHVNKRMSSTAWEYINCIHRISLMLFHIKWEIVLITWACAPRVFHPVTYIYETTSITHPCTLHNKMSYIYQYTHKYKHIRMVFMYILRSYKYVYMYILRSYDLVQDWSISSALAMGILQSWAKPPMYLSSYCILHIAHGHQPLDLIYLNPNIVQNTYLPK